MRKLLLAIAATLAWPAFAQDGDAVPGRLESVLIECSRNGYIEMDLYTVASSREAEELGNRMQAAIERNPEWIYGYVREHADARPLPYHPNFGVTKEEYFRMFKEFEKSRRFIVARKGRISVSSSGNGRFRLDGAKSIPWMRNIVIDLRKLTAEIPEHASLNGKPHIGGLLEPVGKVEGFAWRTEESKEMAENLEDFDAHVVRLVVAADASNQLVISLKDTRAVDGVMDEDHMIDSIMRYTGRSTRQGNLQ